MLSPLHFMLFLDDRLAVYINSFAHRSWRADYIVWRITNSYVFKGSAVMMVYWWAWFCAPKNLPEKEIRDQRDTLLSTLMLSIPVVLLARLMALLLPFRDRPLHNAALHIKLAFEIAPDTLESWSSFPSDHAALFFALATGIFLVSRRAGWVMYVYTALVISLPRVYLGIHYPSDVLGGALLGIAAGSIVRDPSVRHAINWPAERLRDFSPGLFYAFLFQLSFQTAALYEPLRQIALSAMKVLQHHTVAMRF